MYCNLFFSSNRLISQKRCCFLSRSGVKLGQQTNGKQHPLTYRQQPRAFAYIEYFFSQKAPFYIYPRSKPRKKRKPYLHMYVRIAIDIRKLEAGSITSVSRPNVCGCRISDIKVKMGFLKCIQKEKATLFLTEWLVKSSLNLVFV